MAGDSSCCLSFWRWCCCVYIVLVGMLGGLIGLLLTVSGGLLLWGTATLNSLTTGALKQLSDELKSNLNVDFNLEGLYTGVSQLMSSLAIFLLIFGLVILIVSCLGCWGACCGVPGCLIVYSVLVGILFIAEAVVIIMWFSNRNTFKDVVKTTLENQVKNFKGLNGENVESLVVNLVQIYVGCCGVTDGSDYTNNMATQWNRTYLFTDPSNKTMALNLTYPVSCCKFDKSTFKIQDPYCPYNGTAAVSNFNDGCYQKLMGQAERAMQFDNFFFGLIGWAVLELLLILGSVLICLAKRRSSRDSQYSQYDDGTNYKMADMGHRPYVA